MFLATTLWPTTKHFIIPQFLIYHSIFLLVPLFVRALFEWFIFHLISIVAHKVERRVHWISDSKKLIFNLFE